MILRDTPTPTHTSMRTYRPHELLEMANNAKVTLPRGWADMDPAALFDLIVRDAKAPLIPTGIRSVTTPLTHFLINPIHVEANGKVRLPSPEDAHDDPEWVHHSKLKTHKEPSGTDVVWVIGAVVLLIFLASI